jgi:hypothetical protein
MEKETFDGLNLDCKECLGLGVYPVDEELNDMCFYNENLHAKVCFRVCRTCFGKKKGEKEEQNGIWHV